MHNGKCFHLFSPKNTFFIFIFAPNTKKSRAIFLLLKSNIINTLLKEKEEKRSWKLREKKSIILNTNDWSLDPINFSNHPQGTYDKAKKERRNWRMKGLFMTIRKRKEKKLRFFTIDYILSDVGVWMWWRTKIPFCSILCYAEKQWGERIDSKKRGIKRVLESIEK